MIWGTVTTSSWPLWCTFHSTCAFIVSSTIKQGQFTVTSFFFRLWQGEDFYLSQWSLSCPPTTAHISAMTSYAHLPTECAAGSHQHQVLNHYVFYLWNIWYFLINNHRSPFITPESCEGKCEKLSVWNDSCLFSLPAKSDRFDKGSGVQEALKGSPLHNVSDWRKNTGSSILKLR